MPRSVLILIVVASLPCSSHAIVESVSFRSTLQSVRDTEPASRCYALTRHHGFDSRPVKTELDDCGFLVTSQYHRAESGNFRLYDELGTRYGVTGALFSRRLPMPLGFTERPRHGMGIVSTFSMIPLEGAAEGAVSMAVVERLPAPKVDFSPVILSLDVRGEGLEDFNTASVNVFNHDTNELLLSWENDGTPLEMNNGLWFAQEIDFDEHLGDAIRFEFEADGRTVQGTSRLSAAVFINIPEPHALALALPLLLPLGLLRRRRSTTFIAS